MKSMVKERREKGREREKDGEREREEREGKVNKGEVSSPLVT